jgi:hypothetical protein
MGLPLLLLPLLAVLAASQPCSLSLVSKSDASISHRGNASVTSISASGPVTFEWSTGDMGAVVQNLYPSAEGGPYIVTASGGCTASLNVTVEWDDPGVFIAIDNRERTTSGSCFFVSC